VSVSSGSTEFLNEVPTSPSGRLSPRFLVESINSEPLIAKISLNKKTLSSLLNSLSQSGLNYQFFRQDASISELQNLNEHNYLLCLVSDQI
jgi:hypothetical protein